MMNLEAIFKDQKQDGIAFYQSEIPLGDYHTEMVRTWLPEKLEKAAPGRIKEFLAGRYCALKAAEKLGHKLESLPVGEQRGPCWPDELIGSISHTKKTAVAVVALKSNLDSIGIDIEPQVLLSKSEAIEKMVATDKDMQMINYLGQTQDKLWAMTLLFSAKEALYKCLYPLCQCYIEFKEANLISVDTEKKIFELELVSKKEGLQHLNLIYKGHYLCDAGNIFTIIKFSSPS